MSAGGTPVISPASGRSAYWRHGMLLKLAGIVGLVLLLGVFGVHLFTVSITQHTIEQDLRDEAVLTGEALAAGFEHRGSLLSAERVKEEVDNLVNVTKNLDRIAVYRDRGGQMQYFVSTEDSAVAPPTLAEQKELELGQTLTERRESRESGPYWRVLVPLHLESRVRGAIEVRMSLQYATESLQGLRRRARLVALLSVIASFVALAFFLHRSVERPVQSLLSIMGRVEGGELDATAPAVGGGEFTRLSTGLNAMLRRIRAGTEENQRLLGQIRLFNQQLERRVAEKTVELEERNRELRLANQTLLDLELRLARLSRLAAVGQFAATLAHEIGTPLQSISGHLELLRERQAVQPAHEHRIQVIQSQLERVAGIVRELLNSTRPPGAERRAVDLGAVLHELSALLQPGLELRNIRMVFSLPADLPRVSGDPNQLQQVFLNLFTNAVDALPQGGAITVTAAAEGDPGRMVRCEVTDSGVGIPADLVGQVFEPFVTSKSPGEGTGLGLTVARDIVTRHGGTLTVTSEVGRGSCFAVRLPSFEETNG